MISRRTILLLVVLLIVFGASAWFGYTYRKKQLVLQKFDQDGWCCVLSQRQCIISKGVDACKAQGGATFNWDHDSCDAACHPPVRRGQRSPVVKPATPTTSVAP